MFRNVTRPDDAPYLYKKSSMKGITTKYAKRQPEIKRPMIGAVIVLPMFISFSFSAGFRKFTISRIIIGVQAKRPTSAAIYTCAKNAWPGAVCINCTSSGTKLVLK